MDEHKSASWPIASARIVIVAVIIALLFLMMSAFSAKSQEAAKCMPWDEMKKTLVEKAGLFPVGPLGMFNEKAILTLFANFEGHNWALVVLNSNNSACIVATGVGWNDLDLKEVPHPKERQA